MNSIRMHVKNSVHFITNRCEQEMFLLRPAAEVNRLILFWLAKAMFKYGDGIELYAFIFMSNHFHLLLKDTKGQLAQFMCYFQGNVAKSLNRHHKRRGRFWFREYDDIIVSGEEEFFNRYAYTVGNPVKSGLVASAAMWRGVSSYSYTVKNRPVEVTGINTTAYHEALRYNREADPEDFKESYTFKLTHPPAWRCWSNEKRAQVLNGLLKGAAAKYRKDRNYKKPLGIKKVMKQNPFDSPRKPARSPRFKFFCFDKERLAELQEAYQLHVMHYRSCMQILFDSGNNLRRAAQIKWPDWSYPPTARCPAGF